MNRVDSIWNWFKIPPSPLKKAHHSLRLISAKLSLAKGMKVVSSGFRLLSWGWVLPRRYRILRDHFALTSRNRVTQEILSRNSYSSDGEYFIESVRKVRKVRAVGDFLMEHTTNISFYNTTLRKLYSYGLLCPIASTLRLLQHWRTLSSDCGGWPCSSLEHDIISVSNHVPLIYMISS